jgi:sulfur carrier protein ThiS
MKVSVKLYGTLPKRFREYNAALGMVVELADGAKLNDLLAHLKLTESDGCFATVEGQLSQADDALSEGASVSIFQRLFGG